MNDTAGMSEELCQGCDGCAESSCLCTAKVSIFAGLSQDSQRRLVRIAHHRDFRRGETVFRSGDKADSILIVRFGKLKLSRISPDGQEVVLDLLSGGDVIGEQTLYSGEVRGMDGIALEDCGICLISVSAIAELVMHQPDMGVRLLHSMGRKLSDAQRLVEILSCRHAQARLAGFLLLRLERAQTGTVDLSHEDIASSINLSRETVTRKLALLEEAGLIRLAGYRRILVREPLALRAQYLADLP